MPKQQRTRRVTAAQVRTYVGKAEEFAAAADAEQKAGRFLAATSLAVHAAINSADAVSGARLGERSAGDDHRDAMTLLRQAGPDGVEVAKELRRLLPLKSRAEYEPDDLSRGVAAKAVERAQRCVVIARRVAAGRDRPE